MWSFMKTSKKMIKLCLLVLTESVYVFLVNYFTFLGFLKSFQRNWYCWLLGLTARGPNFVGLGEKLGIFIFVNAAKDDGGRRHSINSDERWPYSGKPRCKQEVPAKNPKSIMAKQDLQITSKE